MGAAFLRGGENPAYPVVEGGRVHVMVVAGYEVGSPWDGVPVDQDHGEAGIVVQVGVELLVPECQLVETCYLLAGSSPQLSTLPFALYSPSPSPQNHELAVAEVYSFKREGGGGLGGGGGCNFTYKTQLYSNQR